MAKKFTLVIMASLGALMAASAALSGAAAFLFGGDRAAFTQFTVVWFAPLYLSPLALVGAALILTSSLVSKERRRLAAWSTVAMVVLLALTFAVFSLTGLANGETELVGTIQGTVAVAMSLAYAVATLFVAGVGVLVIRDIAKTPSQHHAVAA